MSWPVSAAFAFQVTRSHRMVVRVDLYTGSTVIKSDLRIDSGQVQMTDDAATKRTVNLNVIDETGALYPRLLSDPLTPAGNELHVYRGIVLDTGVPEYVPLGVFGINQVQKTDSGDSRSLQVSGGDRSVRVGRAKLKLPVNYLAGVSWTIVVKDLIQKAYPEVVFSEFPSDTNTIPSLTYEVGDDPWEKASKLAADFGYDLDFDGSGFCRLYPTSILTYRASRDQIGISGARGMNTMFLDEGFGTVLALQNSITNSDAVNRVIVIANTPGQPVLYSTLADTDPTSPTYIGGPFGDVPYVYKSNTIIGQSGADTVASYLYAKMVGKHETTHISMVPDPSMELRDALWIRRAATNIDDLYLIDKITMPLVAVRAADISGRQVA